MDGISVYNEFLRVHQPQLQLSGVPERYWPVLYRKLKDQLLDAGETFSLLLVDYEERERALHEPTWAVQVHREGGMQLYDATHVYLVDHAWTFRSSQARAQLRQLPVLLQRMGRLMGLRGEGEDLLEDVCQHMWKYAQTYNISGQDVSAEDGVPIWYIMDELGSAIPHSDEPNMRAVPFIHVPEQVTYTLLFPLKNIKEGELVTRDFVEGNYSEEERRALLIPWQGLPAPSTDYSQEEPLKQYFLTGHVEESLPNLQVAPPRREPGHKLKVYSQYERINENLTHPDFEIVSEEAPADILWFTNHFKNFKELSELAPHKYVNQFPFENVLTIKDLLCIVARRKSGKVDKKTLETWPRWLPTTYNLKTELPKFVAYFQQRELQGRDNLWICKPFNLARALDTHITSDINFISRLPLTGPKIAQKYIHDPVLFLRPECEGKVKFDIRYVILLKSVEPLQVYVYKNFFLRFANKPFALNNFDEYEQHFTVMNYTESATLCKMLCADFVGEWGQQYPEQPWVQVEESILLMLRELFECAVLRAPPQGVAPCPQARALYAADIMLAWREQGGQQYMQPQLLEVNWMPDCNRACQYYPDFYNDIFSLLFLDKTPDTCLQI